MLFAYRIVTPRAVTQRQCITTTQPDKMPPAKVAPWQGAVAETLQHLVPASEPALLAILPAAFAPASCCLQFCKRRVYVPPSRGSQVKAERCKNVGGAQTHSDGARGDGAEP